MERPKEPGWMWLKDWAAMEEEPQEIAVALANPLSRKTSIMFDPRDLDKRSSKRIKVWYQPPHPITGFRRPRWARKPWAKSSPHAEPKVSHTPAQSPENHSHGQATGASRTKTGRFSPRESVA